MRDHLFLLKPGFEDGDSTRYYCPDSAQVEGILSFYPRLRLEMDVTYLKFPRPRQAIVDLIGEENQSAPVLVVGDAAAIPKQLKPGNAKGRSFFAGEEAIAEYLAVRYGIGWPHGKQKVGQAAVGGASSVVHETTKSGTGSGHR
jgi:hypothetical protein